MDLLYVYAVAGAALTGAVAGFVAAGVVRSGGDADAAAEVDHLREQRRRADGAARLERTAKELKQAECDELDRQLRAAELRAEAAQQSGRKPEPRPSAPRLPSTRRRMRPMPPGRKRRPPSAARRCWKSSWRPSAAVTSTRKKRCAASAKFAT